jgi:hypothetical protein
MSTDTRILSVTMQARGAPAAAIVVRDRGDGQDLALAVMAYAAQHGVKWRAVDYRVTSSAPALHVAGSPLNIGGARI